MADKKEELAERFLMEKYDEIASDEADEERTFECPECGSQVPSKSEYCVDCQQKVDRK